jgi:hypothetical protein
MLEKLAILANKADQYGEYEFADSATEIIRTAQLWNSLRTLFDPEHTPGLDRNTPFWKRLSKGWSRGRMDRNLGLVLAIMTERTKLNEKINKLTAPLKEFQEAVSAFYEQLRSGAIKSDNFRSEARNLQKGLKETLNLISGKDLRQILKMRERLESQQLSAAEKIKGLDEETKNNLMSALRGEDLPGMPAATGRPSDMFQDPNMGTDRKLRQWLKKFPIARLSFKDAKSPAGSWSFRKFMEKYGAHPKAVADFFNNNASAQADGFDLFPEQFSELLRHANEMVRYDDEISRGVHRSQQTQKQEVPGALDMPERQDDNNTEPMIVPPAKLEDGQKMEEPIDSEGEKKLERLQQEEAEKLKRNELIRAIQNRGKIPQSIPTAPLARSTAERMGREITRLGRVRALNKIAEDEDMDIYEALPEGRERFDEGKDYDPTETRLQMEKGPTIEDDEGREYDPLYERHVREQSLSIDFMLNSVYRKMQSVIRLQEKVERMENIEKREEAYALLEAELNKLQQEVKRLDKEKASKKENKLPDGWAND